MIITKENTTTFLVISTMHSTKLSIFLFGILFFLCYSKSKGSEDYYDDDDDHNAFEDCEYEIDFKTYIKSGKLNLCDALKNPSAQSRIQLEVFSNHTEGKLRLRASGASSKNPPSNQSLITLITDIVEDFKYPTSLLTIDDYQYLSLSTLQSILSSLINVDLNLLSKNLKKTLISAKGKPPTMLSCSGTAYPKQDLKALNITPAFTKAISCNKEPQHDRFFTLEEKMYLHPSNQKNFTLIAIHQDDPKKISRTTWYTCNNPTACKTGSQDKQLLDKTINYALKALQKARANKKTVSG